MVKESGKQDCDTYYSINSLTFTDVHLTWPHKIFFNIHCLITSYITIHSIPGNRRSEKRRGVWVAKGAEDAAGQRRGRIRLNTQID